ncbi:MAG: hypothetical protein R3Y58_13730 [Eubacteriales bacterium]
MEDLTSTLTSTGEKLTGSRVIPMIFVYLSLVKKYNKNTKTKGKATELFIGNWKNPIITISNKIKNGGAAK